MLDRFSNYTYLFTLDLKTIVKMKLEIIREIEYLSFGYNTHTFQNITRELEGAN